MAFGAARLTAGDGWGVPDDLETPRALLRAALEVGIDHIDTADALGSGVSEAIIGEVVGDRSDVLISTKVGMLRPGPGAWDVLGHPNYLRQQVHASLFRLKRERVDLLYLHRIDPNYPVEDQLGALQELRDQGLVGKLGVSQPTLQQLKRVLELEPDLAAVQNLYNLAARNETAVAELVAERGVAFVAYWPLIGRGLDGTRHDALFAALDRIGQPIGLSAAQLSLAWIFTTLPHAIAVVGTRSQAHLAANVAASGVRLDAATVAAIEEAAAAELAGVAFDPGRSREDR